MYWGGVIYSAIVIGVVLVFLFGRLIVTGSWAFINDSEFKRPWPFDKNMFDDLIGDCGTLVVIVLIIIAAVFAWPATIIVAIVAGGLHSARFAVRTGKKLGSPKEKSHEHPESVPSTKSSFSW